MNSLCTCPTLLGTDVIPFAHKREPLHLARLGASLQLFKRSLPDPRLLKPGPHLQTPVQRVVALGLTASHSGAVPPPPPPPPPPRTGPHCRSVGGATTGRTRPSPQTAFRPRAPEVLCPISASQAIGASLLPLAWSPQLEPAPASCAQ